MEKDKQLFANIPNKRTFELPDEARLASNTPLNTQFIRETYVPTIDQRMLDIFMRAKNPNDPFELRNLWLSRIEYELRQDSSRPLSAKLWESTIVHRQFSVEEILTSRATVRFIKELFNWYFRDDLYGEFHSNNNIILSSGSVNEESWGLSGVLKDCIQYALDRDWYGYSDSRGRIKAREAIASYESAKMKDTVYDYSNVAITMGATFAINSIAEFILHNSSCINAPALCAIPNYPPLVESISRRHKTELVPVSSFSGKVSLDTLISKLSPSTPLVMLQTVINPTGASVDDSEIEKLIKAASSSTIILLDECHEWLGEIKPRSSVRASPNVIRVSSISKSWSSPGLKVGWILADTKFISEYYEYASTTFGGPQSFFYTLIEVLTRMERWIISGVQMPGKNELEEFEKTYGLNINRLQSTYLSYVSEKFERDEALTILRKAAIANFANERSLVIPPKYSINMAIDFRGWDDSYMCFRDILRKTGVSVYPGILSFCFSGSLARITTSCKWKDLSLSIDRFKETQGLF